MKEVNGMNTNYSIIKPLKNGGQKNVFLVQHKLYGKAVMKTGHCSSPISLERIKREVSILRGIDSNYFPKNYDFTYDKSGNFVIFEEYIDAKDLNEYKDYFTTEEKILILGLELINGLKTLWDKNIVHRDLKPGNILINKSYKPIIIDLGIARFIDGESLTKTIYMIGPCTPIYASPEQLMNKKSIIDIRTDFFSIGIILAELYLGCHPFEPGLVGDGVSIVDNILRGKYVLNTESKYMSQPFKNLIKKLLGPQPYNRFRTYEIFKAEIEKILMVQR
jgi:serine/threonine-protein kinase